MLFPRFSLKCAVEFFYSAARPLHGRFPTKQFVNNEMYCSPNLAKYAGLMAGFVLFAEITTIILG